METNCESCIHNDVTEVPQELEAPPTAKVRMTKPTPEPGSKRSCREDKSRKKDDKSMEQVLKALNSLNTPEEKLAAMCKKYADIVEDNRKLQLSVKQGEKRASMLQREKEQLQTEHSKAVLTRSRLESLCRELQRQNKAIKDESLQKIREEEEKRKEVSGRFQATLAEITALMNQNKEKNAQLRDDNIEMTQKLKGVCEQYEMREQQVEKIKKQMDLENQLAEAKLAKLRMEMAAEREILTRDKHNVMKELNDFKARCAELEAVELGLRQQLGLYTDKYDEFQNALTRSNEVFNGFKGEMEKMTKKMTKLEKETSSWKQRWEKSHQALIDMAADKQQRDNEYAVVTRQLTQLQKLCRTLQKERTSLLNQLKASSIPWEESNHEVGINGEVKQACEELSESFNQLGKCCTRACDSQSSNTSEPASVKSSADNIDKVSDKSEENQVLVNSNDDVKRDGKMVDAEKTKTISASEEKKSVAEMDNLIVTSVEPNIEEAEKEVKIDTGTTNLEKDDQHVSENSVSSVPTTKNENNEIKTDVKVVENAESNVNIDKEKTENETKDNSKVKPDDKIIETESHGKQPEKVEDVVPKILESLSTVSNVDENDTAESPNESIKSEDNCRPSPTEVLVTNVCNESHSSNLLPAQQAEQESVISSSPVVSNIKPNDDSVPLSNVPMVNGDGSEASVPSEDDTVVEKSSGVFEDLNSDKTHSRLHDEVESSTINIKESVSEDSQPVSNIINDSPKTSVPNVSNNKKNVTSPTSPKKGKEGSKKRKK